MLQEGHVQLGAGNDFDGLSSWLEVVTVLFDAVALTIVQLVNIAALKCLSSPITFPLFPLPQLSLPFLPIISLLSLLSLFHGCRILSLRLATLIFSIALPIFLLLLKPSFYFSRRVFSLMTVCYFSRNSGLSLGLDITLHEFFLDIALVLTIFLACCILSKQFFVSHVAFHGGLLFFLTLQLIPVPNCSLLMPEFQQFAFPPQSCYPLQIISLPSKLNLCCYFRLDPAFLVHALQLCPGIVTASVALFDPA